MSVTRREHVEETEDEELCDAVRTGDTASFAVLFLRHHRAAARIARRLGVEDVDDVVAEAFTATLRALLGGNGPRGPFLPYLATAIRRQAPRATRWDDPASRVLLEPEVVERASDGADLFTDLDERAVLARAWLRISVRHQEVLREIEVLGRPPSEVAAAMGLTVNAVRVLAWRARRSLGVAYLTEHLERAGRPDACARDRWLPHHVLGGGSPTARADRDQHLSECEDCTAAAAQLAPLAAAVAPAGRSRVAA